MKDADRHSHEFKSQERHSRGDQQPHAVRRIHCQRRSSQQERDSRRQVAEFVHSGAADFSR